ncbi:MAG TPA: DJ-1/PfpI family protein [Kiritimatiellia bacterium]|nr:DJ-1/PfpI family protein [Kiritimatiellia bacterium]
MTRVLIPLADGVEEMEAVIMIDVFRRAGWRVDAVGLKPGVVVASRGVKIVPDMTWDKINPGDYQVIALPGGNVGTMHLAEDERVLDALREHHALGRLVAAVCAAPLVLEKAGIIDQKRITCHPLAAAQLTSAVRLNDRVVVTENIVTSQGPGTTFSFALAIIAIRDGREKANEIARGMVLSGDDAI